jgi:hypothetical protein
MLIANPIYDVVFKYLLETLERQDPFIEALTHDTIVIQLPQIKHKRRNELEEILSIFEVQNVLKFDMKLILPEKYAEIARRLNKALTDEQIREGMLAQEELNNELTELNNAIEKEKELKEEALRRETQAIRNLKNKSFTVSEIAAIFNLSEEKINQLLS